MSNKTSDPVHSFIRVNGGQPNEHYALRSQIRVNGELFTVQRAFPFEANPLIMKTLEYCEFALAKAVGEQIVSGQKPQGAKK